MKYFSIYTGIGGFELGIEKATNGKWECVGYSEINKYAIKTFKKYYSQFKNFGDATKINPKELPDFDLLCGGFPCQSFSIAGKRKGFQDTRGTLFYEICRIVAEKRPRFLFLENVKGLLSADDGRCFATIISSLDELGYNVEWQILNSKNFGVPQNRERVFIIGHLRGTSSRQVFPVGENYKVSQKSRGKGEIKSQLSTAITQNLKRGVYSGGETLINVVGTLDSGGWEKRHENIRRIYSIEGIAPSIPTGMGGGVMPKIMNIIKQNNLQIRRLTPTECERLQGFPDGWTEGVSDTQRYKQLGNAVTVNVIEAIIRKFIKVNN